MAKHDDKPSAGTATVDPPKQEVAISNYKALSQAPGKMATIIRENIGACGLSLFTLDRIKVPGGTGPAVWELPGLKGPKAVESFDAIVIGKRDARSYWSKPFGTSGTGNAPPDCSSPDAINGFGNPGGKCRTCTFAQFGTSKKPNGDPGRGQACKQAIMLLLMRPTDTLPVLMVIPPGSLKEAGQFFMRLTQAELLARQVVVKFSLKKDKNADNIPYHKVVMEHSRDLSAEEFTRAEAITNALHTFFAEQTLHQSDVAE
jgi:hypothetical protein